MKQTKLFITLLLLVAFAASSVDAQTHRRRRRPVRRHRPVATSTANTNSTTTSSPINSNSFTVPNGTSLVGVINEDLSVKEARERDRFTITVREPSEYEGATIQGYVSRVSRSGKIQGRSQMTLNFDRIILRNGDSYRFAGIASGIRNSDGARVDNEGNVESSKSQTRKTGERAAIGGGAGAVIGAIAGGGKGAAIGAILGSGAGAGSVYAQGRENLEIRSGTEITVRSTSPRRNY